MPEPAPRPRWYYRTAPVLGALVLLGPLAFPLLWKSPEFTRFWKWLITLAFTLLTALLIWSTWYLIELMIAILQASVPI